jgi:hypothetical protein
LPRADFGPDKTPMAGRYCRFLAKVRGSNMKYRPPSALRRQLVIQVWRVNLDERAATIKMALQRSRRDDDCRAATITQAVFSSSSI